MVMTAMVGAIRKHHPRAIVWSRSCYRPKWMAETSTVAGGCVMQFVTKNLSSHKLIGFEMG